MLSVKNLSLKFNKEFFALQDVSFDVKEGESVALVGESQSGKTTILRVLSKLEEFDAGEIYMKKIPLKKIDFKNDISLGYIPQSPVFLDNKTVYENFVYILTKKGISSAEAEKMINDAIIEFSIEKLRDEKIKNIRLEDKYILSLIRLSFRKIDVLLVDNIFDKVSDVYVDAILQLIKKISSPETTLLLACTREEVAEKICKRKLFFENGKLLD